MRSRILTVMLLSTGVTVAEEHQTKYIAVEFNAADKVASPISIPEETHAHDYKVPEMYVSTAVHQLCSEHGFTLSTKGMVCPHVYQESK